MSVPGFGGDADETGGATVGSDKQLNGHQRDTMAHIFRHPLSHNIEWHSVLSLLNAVATVQETHKGNYLVTMGSETEIFEPPRHKDIDAEQLALLRRFLRQSGFGPEDGPEQVEGINTDG
jgi:hypothetical protein